MEIRDRFRGFLPVVMDVETSGLDSERHSILDICVVLPEWTDDLIGPASVHSWAVAPNPNLEVDENSLAITRIDLNDPQRNAVSEEQAIRECFRLVRKSVTATKCSRAIITGHNAHFDHRFMRSAATRNGIGRNPFHLFSVIDTVALAAVAYGHTVLPTVCKIAKIPYDPMYAHGARHDAEATAKLFFEIVNRSNYSETDSVD